MEKTFRKGILTLIVLLPIASNAASSGFGSWFKRNIADPVTDASDVIYEVASNGVESVVDVATGAALYITEKTVDGLTLISEKTTEITMDVWVVTSTGVVYVGGKVWDGTKWVASKIMDAKRWAESEFRGNTEGTMVYNVPVALTRNGTEYLATQIFGLLDFKTGKDQFNSFNFNQAYLDIPSGMGSGNVSWMIECYSDTDCGKFSIIDNKPFSPGQRVSTSASDWKSAITSMLDRNVKEAIMVFRITGYASAPSFLEMKFGFEAGMKGVK